MRLDKFNDIRVATFYRAVFVDWNDDLNKDKL
jgi:hypothetical protein